MSAVCSWFDITHIQVFFLFPCPPSSLKTPVEGQTGLESVTGKWSFSFNDIHRGNNEEHGGKRTAGRLFFRSHSCTCSEPCAWWDTTICFVSAGQTEFNSSAEMEGALYAVLVDPLFSENWTPDWTNCPTITYQLWSCRLMLNRNWSKYLNTTL